MKMEIFKVLFLSFQENSDTIGIKYLHAYISHMGFESSILLIPKWNKQNIHAGIEYILKESPDILCVSVMSYEFLRARKFLDHLKKIIIQPPKIIMGGIHPTSDPASCFGYADIIVRGEGEETLLELLQLLKNKSGEEWKSVKGIAYENNGKIMLTQVRPVIKNLDYLPFPGHIIEKYFVAHGGRILSLTNTTIYKKYSRYKGTFLSITTSRGCPFSCTYCCNSVFKNLYGKSELRKRSPESVISELELAIKSSPANILYVNFQDDCFMMHSIEWIKKFSLLYKQRINKYFILRTTPKHIEKEKLNLLKDSGLRWDCHSKVKKDSCQCCRFRL